MSRSCQSATFSSPATAPARTTRASPQIRSETIGFRLCGIADDPFWPLPNGSSTSRTSVRARWRISSANRSSEVASSASAFSTSAWRSRWRICVELRSRLEAEPLAGDPLDLGIGCRVRADGAGELADAHPFERSGDAGAVTLEGEGPAGELEAEGRRLRVDAVGAADRQGLAMLLGTRDNGGEATVDPGEDQRSGVADLERERSIEDVRRRQAVVKPAPLLPEPLGDRVDEGGDVVVRPRLDLGDALRRRNDRSLANRFDRLARDDAGLRPPLQRSELDLQPARQPRFVRPDRRHGRAGVARNHSSESTARVGRSNRGGSAAACRMLRGRCPCGTAPRRT